MGEQTAESIRAESAADTSKKIDIGRRRGKGQMSAGNIGLKMRLALNAKDNSLSRERRVYKSSTSARLLR